MSTTLTDTVLGAVVLQRSMICGVTVMDVQSGVYVAMNSICTSVPSCIQLRKPSALSSESHPDRSLLRALAEVQQLSHAAFCTSELDLIIRQGSGRTLSIVMSTSAYFYNSTQPSPLPLHNQGYCIPSIIIDGVEDKTQPRQGTVWKGSDLSTIKRFALSKA